MSNVRVRAEIDPLKCVIVHRPDSGIARISPKRAEEMLFDDIVHLPKMQQEHDIFTDVLATFIGKDKVLTTHQLLLESLSLDEVAKKEMLDYITDYEELPSHYKKNITRP